MINNIGIILAAGNSSRFILSNENTLKELKQLYLLNNKPIINYSIDAFLDTKIIDLIIIVTNTKCYNQMIKSEIKQETENIIYLINDIDCRFTSINIAIDYINNNKINENLKLIIHDSARPYIKSEHIKLLIDTNDSNVYSQYYLKLVNGLMNIETQEFVNRDNYIEICTPLCINYNVLNKINKNKTKYYEFIPLIKELGLKYKLIEGHMSFLRKITTFKDLDY